MKFPQFVEIGGRLTFSLWLEHDFDEEELMMTVSVKCKVPQLESVVDKGSTTMYGLKKNSDQIKPQGKMLNIFNIRNYS